MWGGLTPSTEAAVVGQMCIPKVPEDYHNLLIPQ